MSHDCPYCGCGSEREERDRLRARVAELEKDGADLEDTVRKADEYSTRLEQRVAELEGALRPFAGLADWHDRFNATDDMTALMPLGECRRARAVLAKGREA